MERMGKNQKFSLSKEGLNLIQKEMSRYETRLSCLIPCLYQIQKEKGWVPPEAVSWLREQTGIPESKIHEVLMFYTLFNKKPVGKFHIQVCCNVSCALTGARKLAVDLCESLQVREGEMRPDEECSVSRVECLGACDQAPVVQINEDRFDKMTLQKTLSVLRNQKN